MNAPPRLALVLVAAMLSLVPLGCGGRQRPPEHGTCRAGREWVPPHTENGQAMDGYCHDRAAP